MGVFTSGRCLRCRAVRSELSTVVGGCKSWTAGNILRWSPMDRDEALSIARPLCEQARENTNLSEDSLSYARFYVAESLSPLPRATEQHVDEGRGPGTARAYLLTEKHLIVVDVTIDEPDEPNTHAPLTVNTSAHPLDRPEWTVKLSSEYAANILDHGPGLQTHWMFTYGQEATITLDGQLIPETESNVEWISKTEQFARNLAGKLNWPLDSS